MSNNDEFECILEYTDPDKIEDLDKYNQPDMAYCMHWEPCLDESYEEFDQYYDWCRKLNECITSKKCEKCPHYEYHEWRITYE